MRRAHTGALAVGLLGWVALYAPLLLGGRTLPVRDLAATAVPWRAAWASQVKAFSPPLWDPASSGGRPLLANPNATAAYPGTALFLVMAPEAAVVAHLALHHLLFGLGLYRLARAAGASRAAGWLVATVCASLGVVWSSLSFINLQASLAWAPWVLATVARAPSCPRQARRRAFRAGLWWGLGVLAGEPVTAALVGATAFVVASVEWRSRSPWVFFAMPAVACGVAAPLLCPFLATLPETARASVGAASGSLAADVLAPRRWIEVAFPTVLGPPFADRDGGFWAAASFPWQRYFPLVFVGSLPVVLTVFALRRRLRLRAWLLAGTAGGVLALVLGLPGVGGLLEALPGLHAVRYGIKLLVVPLLCLPPVLGAGWDELARGWRPGVRRRLGAGAAMTGTALAVLALVPPGEGLLRSTLARAYPASRAHLQAVPASTLRKAVARDALALVLPLGALAAVGPAAGVVAAAALAANALSGVPGWLPAPSSEWASQPPILATLPPRPVIAVFARHGLPAARPSDPQLQRFWAARAALYPEYGVRWGVRYVLARGPDGLEPARSELMARIASTLPPEVQARLAAALGANAVIAPRPLSDWPCVEVDGVWSCTAPRSSPEVYLASRALSASGPEAAAWTMGGGGFRPGGDVVVEGPAPDLAGGEVVDLGGVPHRRRFRVTAPGRALLVVQQSYMSCWTARVDERATRPIPVNGSRLGVEVPAGAHTVELFLDPRPYRLGAAGPIVAALLAAFAARGGARRGSGVLPASPPGRGR